MRKNSSPRVCGTGQRREHPTRGGLRPAMAANSQHEDRTRGRFYSMTEMRTGASIGRDPEPPYFKAERKMDTREDRTADGGQSHQTPQHITASNSSPAADFRNHASRHSSQPSSPIADSPQSRRAQRVQQEINRSYMRGSGDDYYRDGGGFEDGDMPEGSPIFMPSDTKRYRPLEAMPSRRVAIPSTNNKGRQANDNAAKPPSAYPSRAHELKAQLGPASPNVPYTNTKKRLPENDPENYEIKRMRVEERMPWGAIADALNKARIENGGNPTYTDAAVYGRFVRNAPRIAQVQGEHLNPKDYVHLKNEKKCETSTKVAKWNEAQEVLLVESFAEAQNLFWQSVSDILEAKSGKRFSAEDCATRYSKI